MKYLKNFETYTKINTTGTEVFIEETDINNISEYLPLDNNIISLKISIDNMIEMPKLPNNLEYLACNFNKKLKNILKLPEKLKRVNCANCNISELPELPDNLIQIDCDNNNIYILPKLPKNLEKLRCGNNNNNLIELPELPYSLKVLFIVNTSIRKLPKLPDSLEYLYCTSAMLTELPELPENLKEIKLGYNNWIKPIPYKIMIKYHLHSLKNDTYDTYWAYTKDQFNKFSSFEYQKEFLEREPENYLDLKPIGYAEGIEELFPHLFDMDDLGIIRLKF